MNLDLDPAALAFSDEVRGWLAANVPPEPLPGVDTPAGDAAHRAWEHRLSEAGLAVVSWPQRYGGRAVPPLHALLFEEEYHAAGAPVRIGQNGLFLLAPTLLAHGTQEQRDRILPPMARADEVWAQAWSEPEAGSDLAAIRSSAVRTEGGWLLSGQKTWSSRAVVADRAFGLFRSDPLAERHRGLTYLMVDLHAPGVTVRPIRQLGGDPGFAEIFLDEVFVPDADVLGAPGDGWRVAMSTAGHERGLTLRSPGRFTAAARRLVTLWQECGDATLRDRVADAWIAAQAYRMHAFAALDAPAAGSAASLTKLFWSDLDVALHETALDLLGPYAETEGAWTAGYLFALAGPIYAGTNEIQRGIVAHRVLGLPPMRLVPTPEQAGFADVLHDLLSAAGVPSAADSWADGDHGPGRQIWHRLAEAGVTALAVPARWGGLDATPADLVVAAEELGHHAVPGPVAETLAAAPTLLAALDEPGKWLPELAAGRVLATLAAPPWLPYATDADAAGLVLLADRDAVGTARPGAAHASLDRTRRLYEVSLTGPLESCPAVGRALDLGALVCAAQLLGAGRALLEASVTHARTRVQFGWPIGRFQAVQHRLADVAVGLEFARPLVYAAAVTLTARDVSAAKVACADAACGAARAALQVHGAIGYTQEHGLGRWLTKVRALSLAWGTPADHRARVLAELTKGGRMELTEEHRALRDAVRGLLAGHSARAADGALWGRLCKEIGVASLAVPEAYGGSGATLLECHVVLAELGRQLTASPMLGSAVLATQALLRTGDRDLLPALGAGDRIATLIWSGDCAATAAGRLSGEASQVLDAEAADVLLVAAGDALWEVAASDAGVSVLPSDVLDSTRPLATVRLAGVAGRRLGDSGDLLPVLRDLACVALSAEQIGAASRAFEATHAYVQQRVQFGRPIGSFQVIQHRLAEAYLRLEAATVASWTAVEALVAGAADAPTLAAMAKVHCSEALTAIVGEMVQMHGGIAITWEHDAHRYLRRAYGDAELFGAPTAHLDRLAATLLPR